MHNVFGVVPCVEAACKGLFLIQTHIEEQGQALIFNHCQHCFGLLLHFRLFSYNFYFVFFN